jgi:hypothetical protein
MEIINFAIIIDGEVASNITFPSQLPMAEKLEAIYSSSPIFIRTEERIEEGLLWNGEGFVRP